MTGEWWRYPDVEEVAAILLEPLVGGESHTGTETPPNLQDVLPFIRVQRTGGNDDGTSDFATVTVDCFHTGYRTGVKPLAEQVRQFLTTGKHRVGPAVIDRVTCPSAPTLQPWAPGMRRMLATYQFVSRRYLADG